jgi:hypothetical protein
MLFRGTRDAQLLEYSSRDRIRIRDVIEYTIGLVLIGTKDDEITSRVQEEFGHGP